MARFAVWAVGADQPGIVAGVTGVVLEQGGNLADCSMTILAGQFAMVLVVEFPDDRPVADVEAAFAPVAEQLELGVSVRGLANAPAGVAGSRFELAVYGADRPGIVHAVAAALADAGVNITDLATRVIGSSETPVYAALVDCVVPDSVSVDALRTRVNALAAELGLDATLHPADVDVL